MRPDAENSSIYTCKIINYTISFTIYEEEMFINKDNSNSYVFCLHCPCLIYKRLFNKASNDR